MLQTANITSTLVLKSKVNNFWYLLDKRATIQIPKPTVVCHRYYHFVNFHASVAGLWFLELMIDILSK